MYRAFPLISLFIVCWACSQEFAAMPTEELINLAVKADSSKYVEMRNAIFQKVSGPADFQKLADSQESEVYAAIAQAMQQRYMMPETYARYNELLEYVETAAAGHPESHAYRLNMFDRMRGKAQFHNRGEQLPDNTMKRYLFEENKEEELSFVLNKPEFIPFWVEASLKHSNVLQRVYALNRLAGFDVPVSHKTFWEIVKTNNDPTLQAEAVDLITDQSYLPFLYEELKQWNTSERREKQFKAFHERLKTESRETDTPLLGFSDEESLQRKKQLYFAPLNVAIIRAFRRMNYLESVDLLKETYKRPDAEIEVRDEILGAFAQFKDPNTLAFLCKQFERKANADIAHAIASIDIETYLGYLESTNTNDCFMCVMAASHLQDEKIIQPMARIAMKYGHSDIGRQAIDRIEGFKIEDSIEPFEALLSEHWSPEIRQAAVTAIGHNRVT